MMFFRFFKVMICGCNDVGNQAVKKGMYIYHMHAPYSTEQVNR